MKSIMQDKKQCYVCDTPLNLHQHHIFEGRNRKNSDKDGCWVWLCGRHHNMSDEGVHFNKELDDKIKKEAELRWLEYYNKSIDDFIQRYHRNYLS